MTGENKRITFSHLYGEVAYLFTQSPLHRALPIATLDLLAAPAVAKEQLFVFREGEQPVGVALWAFCNEEAAKKVDAGLLNAKPPFALDDWASGNELWLVDLVAPFATEKNRHREIMLADLMSGPFAGKAFKMHQTDPATGVRKVVEVPADAGEKLREQLKASMGNA